MTNWTPRTLTAATLACVALTGTVLAGCAATSNSATPSGSSSASSSASASALSPSAPATTETAVTTAPASGGKANPGTRASMCTTKQLNGAIKERDGQAAGSGSGMSQQHVALVLTNTSSTACTLQGWPGVSFVGDSNGTQLGAAATLNRGSTHATITLQPKSAAQAYLDVQAAAVYDQSECKPVKADGYRVYPPGSKTSLFIKGTVAGDGTVCSTTQHPLMTVDAFIPYP